MNAPITQASWNRVSKRAKERPRLASGASRCTRASKACLAVPEVVPRMNDSRAAATTPPMNQPRNPPTQVTAREPTMIRGSVRTLRSRGASGRAGEHAGLGHEAGRSDEPQRDVARLERERQHQQQQPHRGPDQPHRRRGQPDAGALQLELLRRARRLGGHHHLGQLVAKPAPMANTMAASPTVSCGPERVAAELEQDAARDRGHDGGHAAEQAELRVGLDQLLVVAHRGRHHRGPGDQVGLARDQHQERLEVEEDAGEVPHDQHAQEGPEGHRADDHPPAAALEPVDDRPDQRRRHRERRERQQQVEPHLPLRLAERDGEEHRPGQTHREQGVATHRERVGAGQAGERRRRVRTPRVPSRGLRVGGGHRANGRWPACGPVLGPIRPAGSRTCSPGPGWSRCATAPPDPARPSSAAA